MRKKLLVCILIIEIVSIDMMLKIKIIQNSKSIFNKGHNEKIKYKEYYNLLRAWLELRNDDISIADYLIKMGYRSIAIYGNGPLGKLLYQEVSQAKEIQVKFIIDRNPPKSSDEIVKVITPDDINDLVDAIIITPILDFAIIRGTLSKKVKRTKLLSLEDVIYLCNKS